LNLFLAPDQPGPLRVNAQKTLAGDQLTRGDEGGEQSGDRPV